VNNTGTKKGSIMKLYNDARTYKP